MKPLSDYHRTNNYDRQITEMSMLTVGYRATYRALMADALLVFKIVTSLNLVFHRRVTTEHSVEINDIESNGPL